MLGSNVKKIREEIGASQSVFAENYGVNLFTLRQWERKETPLDSAAAAYMECIAFDAETMRKLYRDAIKAKRRTDINA